MERGRAFAGNTKVVLGEDFKEMLRGIHPSLLDSNTRDVSRSTLDKLDMMVENLRMIYGAGKEKKWCYRAFSGLKKVEEAKEG
ncbi:hypothetical protein Bca4012_083482 [Brassica carinata]|uniref:Uncharacterized protein n=1 Tax=Brassica carinata TaxID=52824 RepID=A0A8X7SJG8_BRACI|nr:hypothetical protein Bca52824_027246 [Brassica carinata]